VGPQNGEGGDERIGRDGGTKCALIVQMELGCQSGVVTDEPKPTDRFYNKASSQFHFEMLQAN